MPAPPVNPEHGAAYRDPKTGDLYTYQPDDSHGYLDEFPWEWTRHGVHEDWLAASELPAGLELVPTQQGD